MIFQAFRTRYPVTCLRSVRAENNFIAKYPSFRVPCAPCRSSFSAAFEDVKRAREMGFVSSVRLISSKNQL